MLLLFSHSGFSDTEANGITMKNLLSAYAPGEKSQFYCNTAAPDFSAAEHCFRVTDVQMLRAFFLRKSQHIFVGKGSGGKSTPPAKKISGNLKRRKYNFWLKWLREWLRGISPWGHSELDRWIDGLNIDALVYMVGESHFMDKLVLKTCKKIQKPLVLYHTEAYRIIDLRTRKGLERMYYKKSHRLYAKLSTAAKLIIYNSQPLKCAYEEKYPSTAQTMIAYNSADLQAQPYTANDPVRITYFGNLGVGRHESLLEAADCLQKIDARVKIDVYGSAPEQIEAELRACEGIRFCGFLQQDELQKVIEASDILLHVESFDPQIMPKLRYAFSTKIAQCLSSGRCFLSYAPETAASSEYLRSQQMPIAGTKAELETLLKKYIKNEADRAEVARRGRQVAAKNHDLTTTAHAVREKIDRL